MTRQSYARWTVCIVLAAVVLGAFLGRGEKFSASTDDDQVALGADLTSVSPESALSDKSGSVSQGGRRGDERETGPNATKSDSPRYSIEEINELLSGTFDVEHQQEIADEEHARQQYIAACMHARGFAYEPVDYDTYAAFEPTERLATSSREYAETHGLGVSTVFEDPLLSSDDDIVDPNQEYVESLSPAAQHAYYVALYGEPPTFDVSMLEKEVVAAFETHPELFEPQGCEAEALREVPAFSVVDDVLGVLAEALAAVQRAESDPRIAELEQDWTTCMAEAGYSFERKQDMYEDMSMRMEGISRSRSVSGDELSPEDLDALSDAQVGELLNQPPDIDQELLAELQDYEIDMAVASHDCGEGHNDELLEIFEEYR